MSDRDSEPRPEVSLQKPLEVSTSSHAVEPLSGAHGHGGDAHGAHEHVRQMEDKPNVRGIFAVAVVGIVITVVSVYISWGFQLQIEHQIDAAPVPAEVPGTYQAQGDPGILERAEFPDRKGEKPDFEAQQMKRNQEAQLSTYGWVDRPRGLIRVPIHQAMDQVVKSYAEHK
jgi:hypothetical protein